ncbi:MAG: helix-turn-helix domain-containing protein [Candidatus Wenzhouxiangella sp. M2_3B_020]
MDDKLTRRIETLRSEAASRPTMRYPDPVRQLALELVDELRKLGHTQDQISQALSIPSNTLRRWQKKHAGDRGGSGFRAVDLRASSNREPVLVGPSGWRIEGLSLDELVEVAGRLS